MMEGIDMSYDIKNGLFKKIVIGLSLMVSPFVLLYVIDCVIAFTGLVLLGVIVFCLD